METTLKEWIEKSGYPLELRAEKILRKNEFSVYNSEPYKDSESNIKREIDLLAERSLYASDVSVSIHLVIECKKSEKPFIVLEASENPLNKFSFFTNYYVDHRMCHPSLSTSKNFEIKQSDNHCAGFKIVQGFSNSDETLYKAGFGLSKAFYFNIDREEEIIGSYIEDQVYTVYIPLLVIDAPFYSASLDDNLEISLRKIDTAIWRSHQITTKSDEFSVVVVSIEYLESISKSIINTGNSYLNFLMENKSARFKKRKKSNILKK